MNTITFDTLSYVERLEKAGASRELASALAEAHKEAFSEAFDTQLATKSDLLGVKSDLQDVKNELKTDISRLENRIEALELRMTVKFGVMLAAAVGVMLAVLRVA